MFFKCSENSSASSLLISPLSNCLNLEAFLGILLYKILNGDLLLLLLIESLYANFSYGKIISHSFFLSPTKHLNKFPKLLLKTSIYLSICRWCDVIKFKYVLNFFHDVCQKYPIDLVSWYETILFCRPCSLTTSLKNYFSTWTTSLVFLQGIKCSIFDKFSTTTKNK